MGILGANRPKICRWNPAICLIQAQCWLRQRLFNGPLIKVADFARILPAGRDGNGALGRVHHHGVLPVVLCGY